MMVKFGVFFHCQSVDKRVRYVEEYFIYTIINFILYKSHKNKKITADPRNNIRISWVAEMPGI